MLAHKGILTKAKRFVKANQDAIILFVGAALISLFSFALGFIAAKQQEKTPLKFKQKTHYEKNSSPSYFMP